MQLIKPIGSFLAHTAFINSQRDYGYRPQGLCRMIESNTPSHFLATKPKISVIHEVCEPEPQPDSTTASVKNTERGDKLESLADKLDNFDLNLPYITPKYSNTTLKSPLSRRLNPSKTGGPLSPTEGHSDHDYDSQNQDQIGPLEGLQETLKIDKNDKNEMKSLKNRIVELQNALMIKTMELKMAQNSKKSKNSSNQLEIRMNLQITQEKFLEKCKFMRMKLMNGIPVTFTIKMNGDPEKHFLASYGILKMVSSFLGGVCTMDEKYKSFEDFISVSLKPKGRGSDTRPTHSESLALPDSPNPTDYSTNSLLTPSAIYSDSFTDFSQSLDSTTASTASHSDLQSNNSTQTTLNRFESSGTTKTTISNSPSFINNSLQHINNSPNYISNNNTTGQYTNNSPQNIKANVSNIGLNNNLLNSNVANVPVNPNIANHGVNPKVNTDNVNRDRSSNSRWITKNKQNVQPPATAATPKSANSTSSNSINSTSLPPPASGFTSTSASSSSGKWKVLNKR